MNTGCFLFSYSFFWFSAGYRIIEVLFSACIHHLSGLTLPAASWITTVEAAGDHIAKWSIPGPGPKVISMPRAVRKPGFVRFSIPVLLCTTAALDEKEKRTQHPRSSLQTYIHIQIIGAHTQSSGGLMTSLDWSSSIWVSPWHPAALHCHGFLCDNLLFPNISGTPSCLPIPFLKVSPIILCHSFHSLSSPTLSWKKWCKGEEGQELWS